MKKFINKYFIGACVLGLSLATTSCSEDYLDTLPTDSVGAGEALASTAKKAAKAETAETKETKKAEKPAKTEKSKVTKSAKTDEKATKVAVAKTQEKQ